MKLYFQSIFLKSGMLAVLIYLLHVLLGGFLWKDYNHLHQPISDLTASGSPNREFLMLFTGIYGVLALIFALSFTFIESRKYHQLVFWGGFSFVLMHVISISYGFFPQDLPGTEATFTGKMHLVVTALIVPFTILSPLLIGFGFRKSKGKRALGNFSLVCGVLIFIFGGLSGLFFVNQLPYFGLMERLNIGTLQAWTFILSYKIGVDYSKYC
jgi:hypothetical protein